MKPITECKKRVTKLVKSHGFKKITLAECNSSTEKSYYQFNGELYIIIDNELSFGFGEDKLMGCSSHICCGGTDCGMSFDLAMIQLEDYLAGKTTKKEIMEYIN